MATHELKTWPEYFEQTVAGAKRFEIRDESDRKFAVGDTLILQEHDAGKYTGRSAEVAVVSVFRGFGLLPNFCIMSVMLISVPAIPVLDQAEVLMERTLRVLP